MSRSIPQAFVSNFLGNAPDWYKVTIIAFLIINPIVALSVDPYIAGWLLILEFIFTLAMALKCYPLLPGGLLAIEAVFIGLTSPETVMHEVEGALDVILLLVFMVAGIYFMKSLLLYIFTKLLLGVRSKVVLSVLFSFVAAFLSAFLDALTVTAVVIAVAVGFYGIYHKVASGKKFTSEHDLGTDDEVHDLHREDLDNFRSFLRSLVMHAAVGTALGGVCTLVGEPQNLLIASKASWEFGEFFLRMAPITIPVFFSGLATAILLELTGWFGYGQKLPEKVRAVMEDFAEHENEERTPRDNAALVAQAITGIWLIIALGFHLADVGLIGLSVIILATAMCGVNDEHQIGHAFEEALPFTALLTVFFAIVGVIADQSLFKPITDMVLALEGNTQVSMFYLANGILSMISDNVFVATIYINEVAKAVIDGTITREVFDKLAVAINTGTNIPSVATPNGQAAFLFLLTSALAPLIRLSYIKMVIMAFPYMIVMSTVGLIMVITSLESSTQSMTEKGYIKQHTIEELCQAMSGDWKDNHCVLPEKKSGGH
ncbi:sodium/proton antiporter NhaB [Aliikangiella coralliicola]|uniref:Na(+)/H(+) antiporter NhaB n=1 Tax=Aliikangiella coralliicola TaxID=2592383 RepID=A0A545TWG8_9GAMM|nr:sodium/proton antiporter NhaB [Aliikangiella coralliicola]TQV81554.1 sodium/proton antiporter NhaB [Aliikangiella coralliicola]